VSKVISDALTDTVIEEAEAIVRAEWMRLRGAAPCDDHPETCCEMPAARTYAVMITSTAILEWSRPWALERRPGWPRRGGLQRRVWPTQRSPPR
jgi:hypothetical protein